MTCRRNVARRNQKGLDRGRDREADIGSLVRGVGLARLGSSQTPGAALRFLAPGGTVHRYVAARQHPARTGDQTGCLAHLDPLALAVGAIVIRVAITVLCGRLGEVRVRDQLSGRMAGADGDAEQHEAGDEKGLAHGRKYTWA